jgi:imidazolonepropionase-like amidohydrolase
MKQLLLSLLLISSSTVISQVKPENGVADSKPEWIALKGATIVVSSTKTIENGTLLIRNGKIEKVGLLVSLPKGTVEIDLDGKYIFPAFIELNSSIGLPAIKSGDRNPSPQLESNKNGMYYWNESIHPEVNAAELFGYEQTGIEQLTQKGFGYALTRQDDGIAQGSSAFVILGHSKESTALIEQNSSFFSFSKGVSRQTYPSSQMGSIALMRQALFDAQWYAAQNSIEKNLSLESLNKQLNGILFFNSRDKLEIPRAAKISTEFGLRFHYIGSGNEYTIADQLKTLDATVVLPINFPAAYDLKDPYVARQIPLSDLKHWELAPKNPFILHSNGVGICLSSSGSEKAADFWKNLRTAVKNGLPEAAALEALTSKPATLLGLQDQLGSLENSKIASFMVFGSNPFHEEAELLEAWLNGERKVIKKSNDIVANGKYNLLVDGKTLELTVSGTSDKPSGKVKLKYTNPDTGSVKDSIVSANIGLERNDITIQFIAPSNEWKGNVALHGKITPHLGIMEGNGTIPEGKWVKWTAVKKEKDEKEKSKDKTKDLDTSYTVWYPNMSYGFDSIPTQTNYIITNATLWTNEVEGIVKDATLVIENGKIAFAGTGPYPKPSGAIEIDAKGKHVTSGIIDEHSHIAISRGVNEGGQAISAEVSIADVVNPEDINIYRQLSGGVTAAQLLHGSANPIGGRSALIKLKWGYTAEEMLIDDAPGFIKFALGENVKQANWGDYNTVRFPQTRMGVEQVYIDAFTRAKEYKESWAAYSKNNSLPKPARDIELDVLVEILDGKRHISCHSYVQSEINMLMKVAESFGFKINTFTHILEGYKVADKMKAHGAGGSTFSDWWAYKYEVNDAIPYNAKVMHDQGIVVAINSDDAEMGRRLNQEAAKSVKYGGMSEEDAWKMVTLNPAKLLQLDKQMGSLKEGKDADIVIWSTNPLSIDARVESTFVDGVLLYNQDVSRQLEQRNAQEAARITTKMMDDTKNGAPSREFQKRKRGHYHCDTLGEEFSHEENTH